MPSNINLIIHCGYAETAFFSSVLTSVLRKKIKFILRSGPLFNFAEEKNCFLYGIILYEIVVPRARICRLDNSVYRHISLDCVDKKLKLPGPQGLYAVL